MYGKGLASTGAGALVVGGYHFDALWQVAAAVGTVFAGALCVKISGRFKRDKVSSLDA